MATHTTDTSKIRNYYAEGTISQYRFVKMNSTNEYKVEECDTAGEDVDGISQEAVTDEQRIDVFKGPGSCKIEAGDATTANANLQTDASGRAIDASTGDVYVAKGLEAADAAGDIIECEFYGTTHLDKQGD